MISNLHYLQMSPLNPEESGPPIFEEFSHLTNVTRDENTEKLTNCRCSGYYSRKRQSGKGLEALEKCLVVPGYHHNCTVQAVYNNLQKSTCIPKKIRTHEDDVKEGYLTSSTAQIRLNRISLCGNGIVEAGEHCDCGYKGSCRDNLGRICNQDKCLWQGEEESKELEVLEEEICECTLTRKVFEQHCGKRKCKLGIPLWVTVSYFRVKTLEYYFLP